MEDSSRGSAPDIIQTHHFFLAASPEEWRGTMVFDHGAAECCCFSTGTAMMFTCSYGGQFEDPHRSQVWVIDINRRLWRSFPWRILRILSLTPIPTSTPSSGEPPVTTYNRSFSRPRDSGQWFFLGLFLSTRESGWHLTPIIQTFQKQSLHRDLDMLLQRRRWFWKLWSVMPAKVVMLEQKTNRVHSVSRGSGMTRQLGRHFLSCRRLLYRCIHLLVLLWMNFYACSVLTDKQLLTS
jgi:hypothetical protein